MKPEERVDLDIAAKLLQSHGLTPKRFTKAERRKGKGIIYVFTQEAASTLLI